MRDLNRSIISLKNAIKLSPANRNLPNVLGNLGIALATRFLCKGALEDIEQAISIHEIVLALTTESDPGLPERMNNLSIALQQRYERTASMEDLDRAIDIEQKAASLMPDHSSRPAILNNLSTAFQRRFERTKLVADLDEAIESAEQSIALTPINHIDRVGRLVNLSAALQIRFEQTMALEDINLAIELGKQATTLIDISHPLYGAVLDNLSNILLARYQHTGAMEDLNASIEFSEQAVSATPIDHAERAGRLNNLGSSLSDRYNLLQSINDLHRAIMTKELAATTGSSSPFERIKAASSGSRLLKGHDHPRANSLRKLAVSLLPMISPRTLKLQDQQRSIEGFCGMSARAASLSLECGDSPYEALEVLESGRGVIAGLRLDVRSDISMLKELHPQMAAEFEVYAVSSTLRSSFSRNHPKRRSDGIHCIVVLYLKTLINYSIQSETLKVSPDFCFAPQRRN